MTLSSKNIGFIEFQNLIGYLFILLIGFVWIVPAQNNEVYTLKADALQGGEIFTFNKMSWKYHAGDDAAWAAPNFDDRDWKSVTNDEINFESGGDARKLERAGVVSFEN